MIKKAIEVLEKCGSSYPSPFDQPCRKRSNRSLGDEFGLEDFGVQLTILEPGSWSSQRHWHTAEDEFIYVLEPAPTLVTDNGEEIMGPGDIVGFKAGDTNGHNLVNRSDVIAKFLVIGSRKPDDNAYYSDIDMQILKRSEGSVFTRKNGEPFV